jgi:hypothetical protein
VATYGGLVVWWVEREERAPKAAQREARRIASSRCFRQGGVSMLDGGLVRFGVHHVGHSVKSGLIPSSGQISLAGPNRLR